MIDRHMRRPYGEPEDHTRSGDFRTGFAQTASLRGGKDGRTQDAAAEARMRSATWLQNVADGGTRAAPRPDRQSPFVACNYLDMMVLDETP
jgi:hypothetical protein